MISLRDFTIANSTLSRLFAGKQTRHWYVRKIYIFLFTSRYVCLYHRSEELRFVQRDNSESRNWFLVLFTSSWRFDHADIQKQFKILLFEIKLASVSKGG